MTRLLPFALAAMLAAGAAASPAHAETVEGRSADPQERPQDPGRDVESVSSAYDTGGKWTVSVRLHGAPTSDTSALLRVFLAERAADGSCESEYPNVGMAAWTNPSDRGGKAFVDNEPHSVNVVKAPDADGRGFTITLEDPRIAGRNACAVQQITLSNKQPFDSVAPVDFPAFQSPPPPRPPGPPGPGPTGPGPAGPDTNPPAGVMTVVRSARETRKGRVRVSVRGVGEPVSARLSLYAGSGLVDRAFAQLTPGQEILPVLRLRRQHARLQRRGRLRIRVVVTLRDVAGNQQVLRQAVTLRVRTRSS